MITNPDSPADPGNASHDESSFSGAGTEGPWDEWDELATGFPDVWDAFDLDDVTEEPEPEYGDFWLEENEEDEETG